MLAFGCYTGVSDVGFRLSLTIIAIVAIMAATTTSVNTSMRSPVKGFGVESLVIVG